MGVPDLAETLLAQGARADLRDAGGDLPLHYAARQGHAAVVEVLCRQAPPAAADASRALHLATDHGHEAVTACLHDHGTRVVVTR